MSIFIRHPKYIKMRLFESCLVVPVSYCETQRILPDMKFNITCKNILSGYLCVVTTVFSHQDGISISKSPKRFLKIPSRDLALYLLCSQC